VILFNVYVNGLLNIPEIPGKITSFVDDTLTQLYRLNQKNENTLDGNANKCVDIVKIRYNNNLPGINLKHSNHNIIFIINNS